MRHRAVRNRWTLAGLAVVTLLGLAALGAPWLAPRDPTRGDLGAALPPPPAACLARTAAPGRGGLGRGRFGARPSRAGGLASQGLLLAAGLAPGASDARLVARHVLPSILGPVIVAATLGVGGAIMAEAALSFVGLGAQPPTPSWGAMIAEGRDLLRVAPWVSLFPGLAIGATVLGVNLLGDGLRDALDVRA